MTVSQHIPDNIKRTCRAIGYAAWLNQSEHWAGLSTVLAARLSVEQRAALAFSAIRSLDEEIGQQVAIAALPNTNGSPLQPLFSHMDEAAFWADMAEPDELEAYCLACFNRMSAVRQSDFLSFAARKEAA